MITCKDCKQQKPETEFHKDRSLKNGRARRCKPCESIRTRDRAPGRRLKRLAIMREGKNKPCTDCGMRFPYYVMQFDHLPGTEKLFELWRAEHRGHQAIIDEMAKCEVVCMNCHMMRTYKRIHPEEG